MASFSISPFALPNSFTPKNTPHRLSIFTKTVPKLSRPRLNYPNVMNKAATISEDLSRFKVHPNLWDDDFIQSLPKPYEAPSYGARAETLIKEVKDMLNAMNTSSTGYNLFDRLSVVDSVERLGIDRYFGQEIGEALDYVYRHWSDKAIGFGNGTTMDLNTIALGFRIFRLHRYNLSTDILEHFKQKNGEFLCSTTHSEKEIKSIINLYRASMIAFPGEKVMDEAKDFAIQYLEHALQKVESSNLSKEIEFNLQYSWEINLPKIEARNYIDIYGGNKSWTEDTVGHICNKKLLELAKLDFNIMQSLQLQELQIVSRWWKESGACMLTFCRHRHVEYYCTAAAICLEAKYSAFRIGVAKFFAIATYLDDLYDTYGTLEELQLFTNAMKRWDPSCADDLPELMKIVYMIVYEGVNEMAREANKAQGRDTLNYARKAWELFIDSYMKEAEWLATGYIPTLEEYLENGLASSASRVTTLQPVLTLDPLLDENILQEIDYPSKFNDLLALALRIRNDTRSFKAEANRGETISCITCYMRDHPRSNEGDTLKYLISLYNETLKELKWEYLKPDNVPTCSKDHANAISKALLLFYKERDGFTISNLDLKNNVTEILLQPVTM